MLRKARLPSAIVLGGIAVIYLMMATRSELSPVALPEQAWPVQTIAARHRTIRPEIKLFGEVVAERISELRPLVTGRVVEVGPNLIDGGLANSGELLLQIDPFDYDTELAEQRWMLQEARARIDMLRRELIRAKELFTEKNVSEQYLEQAELDVLQQEAVVGQREIQVRRAERDLAETRLSAPYDGVVSNVNVNLGKHLGTNDKIADLIDTSRLKVRFTLTNSQYGRLLDGDEPIVGQPVTVIWAVGEKVLEYTGMIERVGAEITSATGGIYAYAAVDTGGEQSELRPGAFVRVTLLDKQYADVMQAPESALHGDDTVYVIEADRLASRRVQVHAHTGNSILFSSSEQPEIADGDLIVTTQLREGGAGSKVVVR